MQDFLSKRGVNLNSKLRAPSHSNIKIMPVAIKDSPTDKSKVTIIKTANSKKIYSRVALDDAGETFYARLNECCKNMSMPFMTGAAPDKWMHAFHINHTDMQLFSRIMDFWFSDNENYFISYRKNTYSIKEAISRKDFYTQGNFDILCVEKEHHDSASNTNVYYSSIIHVVTWKKLDNYSSESVYSISEKNKYIHRLRAPAFETHMKNHIKIDDDDNVSDITFPIDVVYTWVDGNDNKWKEQKEMFSAVEQEIAIDNIESDENAGRAYSDERFRNRDELLYSLRSLETYAPFVRNIFIVTCGQKPEWLSEISPKIKLVNHSDIYSNLDNLPTFNSSGIETQLHHIKELSEHFLYLNDDFMFADFCTPDDFFYPNGILKFFPSEARAYEHDIDDSREEYIVADRNAINLLSSCSNKKSRMIMKHAPYPCSKSYLYELENRFSKEFKTCAANRFRSITDLRPIAFMQYNFGYHEGKAIQSDISNRYLALYKDSIKAQLNGVFVTRKYKTICINDVGITDDKIEQTNELTRDFLESYFPFKSSFEK